MDFGANVQELGGFVGPKGFPKGFDATDYA
jgi:hypothetical protein